MLCEHKHSTLQIDPSVCFIRRSCWSRFTSISQAVQTWTRALVHTVFHTRSLLFLLWNRYAKLSLYAINLKRNSRRLFSAVSWLYAFWNNKLLTLCLLLIVDQLFMWCYLRASSIHSVCTLRVSDSHSVSLSHSTSLIIMMSSSSLVKNVTSYEANSCLAVLVLINICLTGVCT